MLHPIGDFKLGLETYWRGVRWLVRNPLQMLLLLLPMAIAAGCLIYGSALFLTDQEQIFAWALMTKPADWWWLPLYYAGMVGVYLGVLLLGAMIYLLVANILSSPVYEWVSCAVERDVIQGPLVEVSLWQSIKLMGEEIKKVAFILLLSLVVVLVPGLNILSLFFTAFLLGWNFYDYPLARRGWRFSKRLSFVLKDVWAVMGLGICLLIPFVQIILLPMAVAGGTMLCCRKLNLIAAGQD